VPGDTPNIEANIRLQQLDVYMTVADESAATLYTKAKHQTIATIDSPKNGEITIVLLLALSKSSFGDCSCRQPTAADGGFKN